MIYCPRSADESLAFAASIAYQRAPEIESMKIHIPILAALTLACFCMPAMADDDAAQFQREQQACETDAYTYCNDAIPDQQRIAACLRKHWREISRECRKIMNESRPRRR